MIYLRGIYEYSTTHTSTAVYIIGGYHSQDIVAEYKDDHWHRVGFLNQRRYRHGSIKIGDQTIIIGGFTKGAKLVLKTLNTTYL